MKSRFVLLGFLQLVGLLIEAQALPTKCLQAEERQNTCPHIIYKKAALPVAALDVVKGGIICICLSDVKALRSTAMSKVEQIEHKVTLERLAKKHQLTEQDIYTLIRN